MPILTEYSNLNHLYMTILGIVLLLVLLLTIRSEMQFLSQNRELRFQSALSMISIFVMIMLCLTALFHWFLDPVIAFTIIMLLLPILLILAPVILYLRAKSFTKLARERMEEHRKLIREVQDLIDERKREKIKEGKKARGEFKNDDDPDSEPGESSQIKT